MAKVCLHCKVKKDLASFYKHSRMADGHINVCKPCRDVYVKNWVKSNADKRKKIANKWASDNYDSERSAKVFSNWYAVSSRLTGGYDKMIQRNSLRGRAEKAATPIWANKFFIEQAYDIARKRSEVTGIRWEVDHIVPLKSDLVCGLHTHENLQVITKFSNLSKKNFRWPEMPGN